MDRGAWQATVHGVAKSKDNLEEMGRFTTFKTVSGRNRNYEQRNYNH